MMCGEVPGALLHVIPEDWGMRLLIVIATVIRHQTFIESRIKDETALMALYQMEVQQGDLHGRRL